MKARPRTRARALLLAAALAATGCPQCAPDTVGEGVARLTIRNVGAIATLLNNDAQCGFASPQVLASAEVSGEIGGLGSLTFHVDDCTIDAGAGTEVSEDCMGVETVATGKLRVRASRTVSGILTGDAENPIVPGGPDSVRIAIERATFEDFEVWSSASDKRLRMSAGSISAIVAPRLAVAADSGACAIATPHTKFSAVTYTQSLVFVTTPDDAFEADIATSHLEAQNGRGLDAENAITGTMTVFGADTDITGDGDLDPDYDAASFASGYSCNPALAQPESYTCADLTQPLADGAARLTMKMLGAVAGLIDADTTCGFSSASVQAQARASGVVGATGALTLTVDACTINLPSAVTVASDCAGVGTLLSGAVTVSGTKVLTGRFTGNPLQPIVPDDDTPAAFALAIVPDALRVSSSADEKALLATRGTLAGTVEPRTALSAETDACSIATPHARFSAVTWDDAELLVSSDRGSFALSVDRATLSASNGRTAGGENALQGQMFIAGSALAVPSDGLGLDPAYDASAFDAAWQCNPALAQPPALPSAQQCAFKAPLAAGAASLSMRTLATVASLVDADASCGFSSLAAASTTRFDGGGLGDDGVTLTQDLGAGCTIALPPGTVISMDCAGNTVTVSGAVTVTGTKEVTGFFTGDPLEPLVPTSRDPARFALTASFDDLTVESATSDAYLVAHSGELSGVLAPRLALDPQTQVCSIATPEAVFTDVAWSDGDVTIVKDGSAFRVDLDDSALDAVNGSVDGVTNTVAGSVTLDQIPFSGLMMPLDPDYDAAALEASYACVGERAASDETCSFRDTLGNAAARLLVKSVAVAASVLDANTQCGFSDPAVAGAPLVTGAPGGPGALTFTAESECLSGFAEDTVIASDCLGNLTHASGGVVAFGQATKSVTGFLTGNAMAPIFPVTPTAASIQLTDLGMSEWSAYDALADGTIPARATVSGIVQARLQPIAGVSESASAAASAATGGAITTVFSHKTPVAALSDVQMENGTMTIVVGAKTFRVQIDSADLDAMNGGWVGDAVVPAGQNAIGGSIVVDGQAVTLRPDLIEGAYSQAAFNATYFDATNVCHADLLEPVPHD